MVMMTLGAGCSGAEAGPVYTDDEVVSPTAAPTTLLVVPLTTVALGTPATAGIVFDLLSNTGADVAEITGRGAVSNDLVTVDDATATFLSFESTADGAFVAQVSIIGDGPHTICIAETCGVVDPPD